MIILNVLGIIVGIILGTVALMAIFFIIGYSVKSGIIMAEKSAKETE